MIHTDNIDIADIDNESDIADFLTNAALVVGYTNHIDLKTSPGVAIFRGNMLFDTLLLVDWSKMGNTTKTNRQNHRKGKHCPYLLRLSTGK